jgi:hypothetical protein
MHIFYGTLCLRHCCTTSKENIRKRNVQVCPKAAEAPESYNKCAKRQNAAKAPERAQYLPKEDWML